MSAGESPTEQVGTRVLFENDIVRVWDFVLEPGEVSPLHHHALDYLYIFTTDDNDLEARLPGQPAFPVNFPGSYVRFTNVGSATDPSMTHQLANVGAHVHRQILVEFKQRFEADGGEVSVSDNLNQLGRSGTYHPSTVR